MNPCHYRIAYGRMSIFDEFGSFAYPPQLLLSIIFGVLTIFSMVIATSVTAGADKFSIQLIVVHQLLTRTAERLRQIRNLFLVHISSIYQLCWREKPFVGNFHIVNIFHPDTKGQVSHRMGCKCPTFLSIVPFFSIFKVLTLIHAPY